jgi:hypothetical protein
VVVEEAEERIDSVTNAWNVITLKQELRHFWKKIKERQNHTIKPVRVIRTPYGW